MSVLHLPHAFTPFITFVTIAHIPATSVPFYLRLHRFHALPSSLSCSSFSSIFNESFLPLCETHLHCSAEGEGSGWRRDVLGKEMQKGRVRIWEYQNETDLSFTQITDAWVTRKHHFTHHLVHYNSFYYIFIFMTLTEKNLNVQKSNTNTTICTSKCCHREITERVIHPASIHASEPFCY